jgi:hypothetical protein
MRLSRHALRRIIIEVMDSPQGEPGSVSPDEGSLPQPPPVSGIVGRERRHFGAWIDALPDVHKAIGRSPDYPQEWEDEVRDLGFEYVGEGSYRIVLRPIADPDYVVKLLKLPSREFMNRVESIYQGQFRGLFPKVFAHGKGAYGTDYDWMVVENVPRIIIRGEELVPFFPSLMSMIKTLQERRMISDSHYTYIVDNLDYLIASIIAYINEGRFPIAFGHNYISDTEYTTSLLHDVIANSPFIRIAALLVTNLDVEVQELTRGNLGVSREGKLVIVDASIFDDD